MKMKHAFNIQTLFMASLFLNVALLCLTAHLSRQFQALYEDVIQIPRGYSAAPAPPPGAGAPLIHVAQ